MATEQLTITINNADGTPDNRDRSVCMLRWTLMG